MTTAHAVVDGCTDQHEATSCGAVPGGRALAERSRGLLKKAVRHAGPLTRTGLQERLFAAWFNGLVYNQIWEDPRVDARALQLGAGSRVLTISSAGCNALAYLAYGPESVTAVDLNHHHLSLTRLKIGAMASLPSHDALFRFFGCADDAANIGAFERSIAASLDPDTLEYWTRSRPGGRRIHWFADGFYKRSRLGRLLGLIHKSLRAIGRSPRQLLEARGEGERGRVFDEVFAPVFENALLKWIGSSPLSVFSLGIPPSQHKSMAAEAEGDLLSEYRLRARRLLCDWPMEDNCFAWQAVSRSYDRVNRRAVPDYLLERNSDAIRSRLDRLRTRLGSTIDVMEGASAGEFNAFVFLDSQDWMPPPVLERQWRAIARIAPSGSRIIFRTAGNTSPIQTALSSDLLAKFAYHPEESAAYHRDDRSAIYGGFHLYTVR